MKDEENGLAKPQLYKSRLIFLSPRSFHFVLGNVFFLQVVPIDNGRPPAPTGVDKTFRQNTENGPYGLK